MASQKKPNSFFKGMQSDLDNNLLPAESYKLAVNARLNNRSDNTFTLKNAKSNKLLTTIVYNGSTYATSQSDIESSTDYVALSSPTIYGVRLQVEGDEGFTHTSVTFDKTTQNKAGIVYNGTDPYLYLLYGIEELLSVQAVSDKCNISISGDTDDINISLFNTDSESLTLSITMLYEDSGVQNVTLTNGDGVTVSTVTDEYYYPVGAASFSDYTALICTQNNINSDDAIFKVSINDDGTLNVLSLIMKADLGLTPKESLRVEVSEENEHFHRIYWTDGVNPLRTLNLKEDAYYYAGLTAEDLNVFKGEKLEAPAITGKTSGGTLKCGAYSYCYRLVTTDGKTSRISNISNPIFVDKGTPSTPYHEILGGSLEQDSSTAIKLTVDNISQSYKSIEIIAIRYVSSDGAIEANSIAVNNITTSSFSYTHSGGETTTPIVIQDLLANNITWDTCKSLSKKDNRLFASYLSNNSASLDIDMRVKSYRYDSDGNGALETYPSFINPDIDEKDFYSVNSKYGFINLPAGSSDSSLKVYGAETPGFATASDGVRVTFDTKQFDLTKIKYFNNSAFEAEDSNLNKSRTLYNKVPHYGHLEKTFEQGFNNYKNSNFAEKFTGYQRGEVYRFGILFYDTTGSPSFVSPIGDIRMPENFDDYTSLNSSGSRITESSDGAFTFKFAGSSSRKSNSWTADGTNILSKTGHGEDISVGDIVTGSKINPVTYVTAVNTDSITFSIVSQGSGSTDVYFDDPTSDVFGYAIYPKFNVKLSADTRSKISGYSIVRVDRKDSDKSIIASGVFNQAIKHANVDGNSTMKHKNGPGYATPYSPKTTHNSYWRSVYTFDSPDLDFNKVEYSKKENDYVKIVSRLDGGMQDYNSDILGFTDIETQDGIKHIRQTISSQNYKDFLLSGRFDPNSDGDVQSTQFSVFPIYSQYYSSVDRIKSITQSNIRSNVFYSQKLGPDTEVSASRIDIQENGSGMNSKSFKNGIRFNYANEKIIHAPSTVTTLKWIADSNANGLTGAPSTFVSLESTLNVPNVMGSETEQNNSPFRINDLSAGDNNQELFVTKLYGQIRRDASEVRYGGTSDSAFDNNQYISTGHINFNPAASNVDEVFGGDTYICMYSKSKTKNTGNAIDGINPSAAIVFPVESTFNLDLRDGIFFGSTDDINYQSFDDVFINDTYSVRNLVKTFVKKPTNFKDVNTFSNVVAASNLKINGDLFDAYTTWDANEIHELDTDKGPIYNLINLRDEIFAIQQKGVAKLQINPRVVVDNQDASAVTIATGTGRVIERSDYVDTLYGSQHFNNMVVTNTSAYWFDSNMSTWCKLIYGQGVAVQDLGVTTGNAKLFNDLKDVTLYDKPLDYSKGGISLYHNKIFDEVGICISQSNNAGITHLIYSELSETVVTKKNNVVSMAFNLPGELFTIGRHSTTSSIDASKVYIENRHTGHKTYYDVDDTNSFEITFVCNEDVYSSKKFDKLVLYLSGNENNGRFTDFTFTDSVSNTSFTTTGTGEKLVYGKHIIPITSTDGTAKATGQFLEIKAVSTADDNIELFGALIHNRKTT